METEAFGYDLPKELIAQNPVSPRDACRLMVLDRKKDSINHRIFSDLTQILKKGDVLVLNKSKVIPARIKSTYNNKEIEILITKRLSDNEWVAMVRPGKIMREGVVVKLNKELSAKVTSICEDGQRIIKFSRGGSDLDKEINKIGHPPYPPYIKNTHAKPGDYQTVYASEEGSIAAPTAGMHFTDELIEDLKLTGVEIIYVTLHVGLGTFLPVKSKNIKDHKMHSEVFELTGKDANLLNLAKKKGRRIIAVGTTAVRVLESSYEKGEFTKGKSETDIYIYPGYEWKCVDGLLTNFHLPKSTLILLTCSFGGKDFIFRAYKEAVKRNYRFYSFGDAMLIL
jgi:S-adenosylmethionine:tRNA ribosyltransferase-isomerase